MGGLSKISAKITKSLQNFFIWWGDQVWRFHYLVFAGSLILCIAFGIGFTMLEDAEDGQSLWVPEDSQALDDRDKVEDYFSNTSSPMFFYVVAKEKGYNILTYECFMALQEFERQFKLLTDDDGKTYQDYCYKADEDSECSARNHPLSFWEVKSEVYDLSNVSNTQELLGDVNSGKSPILAQNTFIDVNDIFAATTPETVAINENGTNNILEAEAANWMVFITIDDSDTDKSDAINDYEELVEELAQDYSDANQYIQIWVVTPQAISRSLQSQLNADVQLVQIGIVLIFIWSVFSLFRPHPIKSKTCVAIGGLVSVFLAYIEAMGLGVYFGLEGVGVTNVIPFLLAGIGVDDMYVLIFTLEQAPSDAKGKERIRYMMKHAGVSITITSFTNVFAFAMGSLTSLPAVRTFCQFASLGMFFDYFNQITFFLAIVCWDVMRSEHAGKNCCRVCWGKEPEGEDAECADCCGLCLCSAESVLCCKGSLSKNAKVKESYVKYFFREHYSRMFKYRAVQIVILILSAVIISVNCWAASELKLDFDIEWFMDSEDYVSDAIDIRDEYFDKKGNSVDFYSLNADFAKEDVQQELITYAQKIDNCSDCDENWIFENSITSWYNNFNNWVDLGECKIGSTTITLTNGVVPETYFYSCLYIWRDLDQASRFDSDMSWDTNKKYLTGSALQADMIKLDNADDSVQAMRDTRDIADDFGPGDSFPFNIQYLFYEQYAVFGYETALSLSLSCAMVLIVVTLLMADIIGALLVLFMVGNCVIGLLAMLYYNGYTLNAVTMTNAVIAIGISVDYSAHIAHAFKECGGNDPQERVTRALDEIGLSVLNGGISTFLAILPLAFSSSYIFLVFFLCWFSIVLYGMVYGLLLLPVLMLLLSKFIPSSSEDADDSSSVSPNDNERAEEDNNGAAYHQENKNLKENEVQPSNVE